MKVILKNLDLIMCDFPNTVLDIIIKATNTDFHSTVGIPRFKLTCL